MEELWTVEYVWMQPVEVYDKFKLDRSILDLGLSVRSRNILLNSGIVTVRQLVECSAAWLLDQRNAGATSVAEIRRALRDVNLYLYREGP